MQVETEPLKEVLGELFTLLEAQETKAVAILQFLKDQGIATDEKLAPYVEQAGKASSVKWTAARKRMEFLLTPIQKEKTEETKPKKETPQETKAEATPKSSEAEKTETKKENEKREEQAKAAFGAPNAENSPDQADKSGDHQPNAESPSHQNEKKGASTKNEKKSASKQSA